jgi:hypothetical protein
MKDATADLEEALDSFGAHMRTMLQKAREEGGGNDGQANPPAEGATKERDKT